MRNKVISLFDLTGAMVEPWRKAGYECHIFDIQHKWVLNIDNGLHKHKEDIKNLDFRDHDICPEEVAFIAAFPPCDHMAVSGARWFKGKGLRKLADAIELVACAAEICEELGAPYMIENPVSTLSTYWRKPDYYFNPYDYSGYCPEDNYTKKTCLWTGGGFVMPEKHRDYMLGDPDDRIHKCAPGPERANIRSATPSGFAQAVCEANRGGK